MYNKRIVCDIDDTISFCDDRDWENAKPNISVIKKINSMYNDGWEIFLHTARGSISCETANESDVKLQMTLT